MVYVRPLTLRPPCADTSDSSDSDIDLPEPVEEGEQGPAASAGPRGAKAKEDKDDDVRACAIVVCVPRMRARVCACVARALVLPRPPSCVVEDFNIVFPLLLHLRLFDCVFRPSGVRNVTYPAFLACTLPYPSQGAIVCGSLCSLIGCVVLLCLFARLCRSFVLVPLSLCLPSSDYLLGFSPCCIRVSLYCLPLFPSRLFLPALPLRLCAQADDAPKRKKVYVDPALRAAQQSKLALSAALASKCVCAPPVCVCLLAQRFAGESGLRAGQMLITYFDFFSQ